MLADFRLGDPLITDFVISVFLGLLEGVVGLLPAATSVPALPTALLSDGISFFGHLDRYLPIHEMTEMLALTILVTNAWILFWLIGWVYSRIPGKAT